MRLFKRVDSSRVLFADIAGPRFAADHRNKDVRICTGVVGETSGDSIAAIECVDALDGISTAKREVASYLSEGWSSVIPAVLASEVSSVGLRVIQSRRRVVVAETGEDAGKQAGLSLPAGQVVEWAIWLEGPLAVLPKAGDRLTIGRSGEVAIPVENFRGLVASAELAHAVTKDLIATRLIVIEIEGGELARWVESLGDRARPLVYSELWRELATLIPEARRRREVLRLVFDGEDAAAAAASRGDAGGVVVPTAAVVAVREAVAAAVSAAAAAAARPKRLIDLS